MRCANLLCPAGVRPAWLLSICLSLMITACGGGGSDSNSPAPAGTNTSASASSGPGPGASQTAALTNFQDVVVEAGSSNGINGLYTSVTVCAPANPGNCAIIDRILVDTGSTGLRLLSSTLPTALRQALPLQNAASGNALVECTQFADGYSWGPVRLAGMKLGGETISSVPIQVIGDPAYPTVPSDCSSTGPSENTVAEFGSNGVLGVGNFEQDCGIGCAQNAMAGFYYSCGASGCVNTVAATALQVRQPVTLLAKDNNGVVVRLPAPPAEGAVSLAGTLIFGIGTQTNNGLGTARVVTLNPSTGTLPITVNGITYANSFLDSGSNALFFPSPGTPVCHTSFYCPTSPLSLNVIIQGNNGVNVAQTLTVTNADTLFTTHPTFAVGPTLGGIAFGPGTVDLGLPFFFGRTVFNAIEGRSTPGGVGPYVAF